MKKILGILILLYTLMGSSQNKNVLVTYKKEFSTILRANQNSKKSYNLLFNQLKGKSKNFNFLLYINNFQSIFYLDNPMKISDNKSLINLVNIGSNGKYYVNSKSKQVIRNVESFGEVFNIESSLDSLKWKLINESKKIGKYVCYRAETTKIVENSKGVFNYKVIAWYTPQLPFSFGPVGYGGLPGLIVELNYQNIKYYVSKIIFSPSREIAVQIPAKGKKIKQNEYQNLVKILANEYRKSLRN